MTSWFLLTELILAPQTLDGFTFENKRQKYLYMQNYVSTEACQDYALFTKNNEKKVLSLCPDGYMFFFTDGKNEKIDTLKDEAFQNLFFLREKEYLWFLNQKDGEYLYYLHPKGVSQIRDYRSIEGGWLISVQNHWFLLSPEKEKMGVLFPLTPLAENDFHSQNYWHALSGGGYLRGLGILALNFYLAGEKALAIYDTQETRWKLLPKDLLYPEEKMALEAGQNILFRLTVPPGNNRFYFVIYQDQQEVGRTEIHNEGETAFFFLKAKPKRYVFQVKRYTSQQKGDTSKFMLEKNIFQAESVSVNLLFGNCVLFFIRPGKKYEKKAFVLDYTYLPYP